VGQVGDRVQRRRSRGSDGHTEGPAIRANPFTTEVPRQYRSVATWVEPKLVGEVSFSEWTMDRRLRHPSWRGLRDDKRPDEVRRES